MVNIKKATKALIYSDDLSVRYASTIIVHIFFGIPNYYMIEYKTYSMREDPFLTLLK